MRAIELSTAEEIGQLLGQRCRALRLARNVSQAELAARAGVSLSSIRRLESGGRGTIDLLVRVAQALHVVAQFETLLTQPVITIADAEREEAVLARRRAGSPRKPVR